MSKLTAAEVAQAITEWEAWVEETEPDDYQLNYSSLLLELKYENNFDYTVFGPTHPCNFSVPHEQRGEDWSDFTTIHHPVVTSVGEIAYVDDVGGGEGSGETFWLVFSVTQPDGTVQLFRIDGYYQSFDGGHLDGDIYEVHPVEKVVTVYDKL